MLPFWYFPTYKIFGVAFQTWGTFVALGILVAFLIACRKVKRIGLNPSHVWDLGFWIVMAGFAGARLGHVFFYDWPYFSQHISEIPQLWHGGFSSFGGFIGAAVAGVFLIKKHLPAEKRNDVKFRLTYIDALISGLPLGWAIGRIGCFLIHDHPGTLTHFLLGVKYPDGVRHDLGLYDLLNTLGLAVFLLVFGRFLEKRPGMKLSVILVWYGTVRFCIDFLRAYDQRYFGLTPAQFGSVIMVVVGIIILRKTIAPQKNCGL